MAFRTNARKYGPEAIDFLVKTMRAEKVSQPDEAWQRIERLFAGPYLEMFARRERLGWTTWGNEVVPEGPIPRVRMRC